MNEQRDKPNHVIRCGTVEVAIWSRPNGRFVEHSIRVQKRFRDEVSGVFKTTSFFRVDEMPKLQLAAAKAYEFITLRETT